MSESTKATGPDRRITELAQSARAMAVGRGRRDLADALAWRLDIACGVVPVTVVVAGRTNSGKSTLVNALLGRSVVAHGAHIPTTAPAVVQYGRQEAARMQRIGDSEPAPVATAQALELQSDAGHREPDAVRLYEIDLDHPLLRAGLRLVDMPGIGERSRAAERALAAERLLAADVVVFVLDPEAPVSRAEAEFLDCVGGAVADVVFVIGKADLAVDVEAIVEVDRAVLSQAAPRWAAAPIFVLSALEKELGDRTGDRDLAVASGLPALARHLAALAPYDRIVKSAAVVQASRAVVAELEAADRAASASDGTAAESAVAAVETHRRYVEATTGWTVDFGRDYQRCARQVVERDLRLRLLERREGREVRIRSGGIEIEEVAEHVRADLDALTEEMGAALVERVGALMSDWTCRLELSKGVHLPGIATAGPADVLLPGRELAGADWQAREVTHGLAGLVNLARSAGSGRSLAALLPGGLVMGTGVGIVMTGLSWGTSEWLRHKVHDQQGALAFVQAAFARAQIELEASLREHALELQPIAQAALQHSIADRRQELALFAAEQEFAAERAATDADGARRRGAERLAELEPLALRLDGIAERLTAFVRDPGTS
jgi:ethanolamine utilization protein EutP (predicted NTPase)